MSNIVHVTPFLLVPELASALDFFTRVLGFTVPFQVSNYAYITLDAAGMRLLAERTATPVTREHARTTVYIDVLDVDALYAELPLLATLPHRGDRPASFAATWKQEWEASTSS